jgi:hypothetical protein
MAHPVDSEELATPGMSNTHLLILSWLWVAVPLAWGVWETLRSSSALWR